MTWKENNSALSELNLKCGITLCGHDTETMMEGSRNSGEGADIEFGMHETHHKQYHRLQYLKLIF